MGTFSIVFYCSNISHLRAGSIMFPIILDHDPQLTSASNYFVFRQCNFTRTQWHTQKMVSHLCEWYI